MEEENPFDKFDQENPFDQFDGMDPELKSFQERNPGITLTGEDVDTNLTPIPGGGLAVDVTDQLRAAAEQDGPRDYNFYYGDKPADVGFTTRLGATLADTVDMLSPGENEPNQNQKDRDAANAAQAEFQARMAALYQDAPTAAELGLDVPGIDGGGDVRVDTRLDIDENGNVVTRYNRIPAPDSNAFERIIDQTGRNLYQQFGGLLTEGAVLKESELERRVPDLEADGLEGLATDLLTFGLPAVGLEKAGRDIGRGVSTLRYLNTSQRFGRFANVLGASIGASFSDALMSTEGDQGMLISPEMITETFKVDDPQKAEDLAMFVDGMILNGAFDGILWLGGKVTGFLADKVSGTRGLISPAYVRDEAARQSLIGVMNIIDPRLAELPADKMAGAMRDLATVMDANAEALVRIGQTTETVALDTVNAMANGAEQYIRTSRIDVRRTMTDAEWEAYVKTEARDMVERTISVARTQQGSATVRTAIANMSDSVDRAIMTEADRLAEQGLPLPEATQGLVDQRTADVASANAAADQAQAEVDNLINARNTAVSNDPFISSLLASDDPLKFFNNSADVERLRSILGNDLFNEYRTAWKNVNEAYAAIPNVEIDTEKLIGDINSVVREANLLDNTGGQTKRILGEIYRAVQPKAMVDDLGDVVFETADELLARIDGEIGFQDLYRVRQRLSAMIGETTDPAVRNRLTELKDSITNAEDGQLAFVINSGDLEAADAALNADRLYIDTMTRFQNSEPMRRYSDLAAERNAGVNTATDERFMPRGEADLSSGAVNDILPTTTNDVTGYQYTALKQAFDNPTMAATLDSAVADLYIAQGIRNLSETLRGAGTETPDMIISAFREQSRILRETGNPIYSKLEDAAARIERMQTELGDDLLFAEEAARLAREEIAVAEDTIVNNFINKYRPNVATGTPQQTVTTLLRGGDAGDAIQALMDEIKRLPDGQREATELAFQGSVLRSLRDSVFGSTPIGMASADSAAREVRLGAIAAINSETSNSILAGVRAAFPNDPATVLGIEQALQTLSDVSTPSRLRLARAGSDTAVNLGVQDSVSTAILFSMGYMNPTAAAARRLSAGVVDSVNAAASKAGQETVAAIIAAPKEFAILLRAVADKEDPSTLAILRDSFLRTAQEGLRYELRVEPSELANNTMIAISDALTAAQEQAATPDGMGE